MSKQQDKPLSIREMLALRFHLVMCSGCRNYHGQLEMIRLACRQLGGRSDDDRGQ